MIKNEEQYNACLMSNDLIDCSKCENRDRGHWNQCKSEIMKRRKWNMVMYLIGGIWLVLTLIVFSVCLPVLGLAYLIWRGISLMYWEKEERDRRDILRDIISSLKREVAERE
jgi:nitrogen fixation-related uncharacterized protein